MKKLILSPLTLCLLAITLAGCGGEDAIFGSNGSGSNELTLSSFEGSANNIARINDKYRTGSRNIEVINVVGNYNSQGINTLDKTVLADKFEGNLENKNIEVNNRTIKRPIYEKNSNKKSNFETTYQTLDLSRLKANSYIAGSTLSNSRGIRTDLNNYPKISANNVNIAFPSGSVCYIPVTNSERSFFAFNAKNETNYTQLSDWKSATEKRFNDNRGFTTIELKTGANNNQNVTQVRFSETNNDPAYIYSGVDYANKIYEADYVTSGINEPNTNSFTGVVDCTLVNEVAADFLQEQIRLKY